MKLLLIILSVRSSMYNDKIIFHKEIMIYLILTFHQISESSEIFKFLKEIFHKIIFTCDCQGKYSVKMLEIFHCLKF